MVSFTDNSLQSALLGALDTKRLGTAACVIMLWDYLLTIGQEIELFWNGSEWGVSRTLFFLNRYLLFNTLTISQVSYHLPPRLFPENFCLIAIKTCFMLNFLTIIVIQAIITIRVWHLFSNSRLIHSILITVLPLSISLSAYFASLAMRDLTIFKTPLLNLGLFNGCAVLRPEHYWRFFLPSLGLHTLLYGLTLSRALQSRGTFRNKPILRAVITEGGLLYLVVLISTVLTTVGAYFDDMPRLNLPAIFGNFTVTISSVCMNRIMLSIHSLAADFSSSPTWLLNNVELSRVKWRPGARPNEILVDIDRHDEDEEFELGARTQGLNQRVAVHARIMSEHIEMAELERDSVRKYG